MSEKTTVQKIRDKLPFKNRSKEAMTIMHKEAGFIPIFNLSDLEERRQEIKIVLDEIDDIGLLTEDAKKKAVLKTFNLFFKSGSPWYRGLNNRDLSGRVASFLYLFNDVKDLPAFSEDLFMCAMQLLHLSWQALDVTNTPPYIINTQPIVSPYGNRIALPRADGSGGGQEGEMKIPPQYKRERVESP